MKIDPVSPPFILQNIPQYALLQQKRWVIDKINVAAAHIHTRHYMVRALRERHMEKFLAHSSAIFASVMRKFFAGARTRETKTLTPTQRAILHYNIPYTLQLVKGVCVWVMFHTARVVSKEELFDIKHKGFTHYVIAFVLRSSVWSARIIFFLHN